MSVEALAQAARREQAERQEQEQVRPNGAAGNAAQLDISADVLDLAALTARNPPPREWAWHDWIPARTVTLLHGYGGAGKSLLLQQLGTAYSIGRDLFGAPTQGRPAVLLLGEDDADEVWRRQVDICARLGSSLGDLVGKLQMLPVPHHDITLATLNRGGTLVPTEYYAALDQLVGAVKPGLVELDNAAKLFPVAENDRPAVTRAVGMLHGLCQRHDCAVVLASHNRKAAEGEADAYSGSTAWENAVRARLSLARDPETDTVVLSRPKANYAGKGSITLRWVSGAFRCEDGTGTAGDTLEAKMRKGEAEQAFLDALDEMTRQQRAVSQSPNARNYAPKLMKSAELGGPFTERELIGAMNRLFKDGRITGAAELPWRGTDRHRVFGLARVGG